MNAPAIYDGCCRARHTESVRFAVWSGCRTWRSAHPLPPAGVRGGPRHRFRDKEAGVPGCSSQPWTPKPVESRPRRLDGSPRTDGAGQLSACEREHGTFVVEQVSHVISCFYWPQREEYVKLATALTS